MNNSRLITKLLVFSVVARKGSFTAAALELGVTKSSVSQTIKELEDTLRIKLFKRNTRRINLTSIGKALFEKCEALSEQVERIVSDIEGFSETPSGRFAITAPYSIESYVLEAIEKLTVEYPMLKPEIVISDSNLDIFENNIDVAIRAGHLPDSGLYATRIGTLDEIFCVSPTYLYKYGALDESIQVSEHKWIATSWQSKGLEISINGNLQHLKISPSFKVNTLPGAINLVLKGIGFALLPRHAVDKYIVKGKMVQQLSTIESKSWPLNMVHAFGNNKPSHLIRFQTLMSNLLRNAK